MQPITDDVVERLNRAGGTPRAPLAFYALAGIGALLFILFVGTSFLLALVLAAAAALAAFSARQLLAPLDAVRAAIQLTYPANTAASPVVTALDAAFGALGSASAVWAEPRPADLSADVVDRGLRSRLERAAPPKIAGEQRYWTLAGARRRYYFLPDRVLVSDGTAYTGALTYAALDARLDTRTYEGYSPPAGARI